MRLDDVPGFPPPKLRFLGATHELLVAALNPDSGPHTADSLLTKGLPFLVPVNIVEQFTATDGEMRQLCDLSAWAVVAGHLNPETADAPSEIRHAWLTSLVRTLAHIRGEPHAS